MTEASAFQVFIPGEAVVPDVLGIWQTLPAGGSYAQEESAGMVWQVDLADDLKMASTSLGRRSDLVAGAGLALPDAGRRLDAFVRGATAEGVAFDGALTRMPQAERDLAAVVMAGRGAEEFAGLRDVRDKLEEYTRLALDFSEQVRHTVAQFARIQSTFGGRPAGITRVSWLGDFRTEWMPNLGVPQAMLHRQVVELALATRQAWVRITLLVAAAVGRLAPMLASGIGAIAAIPSAWRFITQILDEYKLLKQLKSTSSAS